ncbi:hypothetical protein Taro_018850, partial [Colocasia esculenta]|nr:hypothetical protein [Colocasia esculenta]
ILYYSKGDMWKKIPKETRRSRGSESRSSIDTRRAGAERSPAAVIVGDDLAATMVRVATYFAMTLGAFIFWQSMDKVHVWIALHQDEKLLDVFSRKVLVRSGTPAESLMLRFCWLCVGGWPILVFKKSGSYGTRIKKDWRGRWKSSVSEKNYWLSKLQKTILLHNLKLV